MQQNNNINENFQEEKKKELKFKRWSFLNFTEFRLWVRLNEIWDKLDYEWRNERYYFLFTDLDSDEQDTDTSFLFDRVSFEELSRFDEENLHDEELDDEDFHTVARPPYMFQLTQEYYDVTFFVMII